MLKLVNIKLQNNIIEADYIPENSRLKAHVSINIEDENITIENIEEYGGMYRRMAIHGLRQILDELNSGEIESVPTERFVVWY